MPIESRSRYQLKKTKAALAVQDVALTIIAYMMFVGLSMQIIPVWAFFFAIFLYTFRTFNIRHERAHTSSSTGLKPRWLDAALDFAQLFYLPHHEPYSGKRWKHLAHHRFHVSPTMQQRGDLKTDPHRVFEVGSGR
jgi:fatty acid desaturase